MTWCPGAPQLIRDKVVREGGWIAQGGYTVLNLYKPPVLPRREGDPELWLEHGYRIYGNDVHHVLRWLAHRVQRPHEKINHALVLGGAQGIGKDTLLEPVKQAIGPWNFTEVSPQQALGRFNGFLKSVILRVSEARDLGRYNRYAFYDHMKAFPASPPDILRIDEKNRQEYAIFNVVAASSPRTTRPTAYTCRRTIAATSSLGRIARKPISTKATGAGFGAGTSTAATRSSPTISQRSIYPGSTQRHRRRRRRPFGRSSARLARAGRR